MSSIEKEANPENRLYVLIFDGTVVTSVQLGLLIIDHFRIAFSSAKI